MNEAHRKHGVLQRNYKVFLQFPAVAQIHANGIVRKGNIRVSPVPCKSVFGIEPAGLFVFPQDEHKGVLVPILFQPTAGFLYQNGSVPLAPLVGMGIEGRDLSPALLGAVVKLADLAGIVVFHACGAEVNAGNRNISSVK